MRMGQGVRTGIGHGDITCVTQTQFSSFPSRLPHLLFFLSLFEVRARVGRPQTSSSPPVIFIAGRPKAALLFWFFGDFRCGALLFMLIHVICKYKNR